MWIDANFNSTKLLKLQNENKSVYKKNRTQK